MSTGEQAERDRMHSYLVSQGERYSFSELWPRVCRARLELLDALSGVSDEQAVFAPAPGEWSIREVADHILNSSCSVRGIVASLASGKEPDPSGVEPAPSGTDVSVQELRDQLREDGIVWTAAIAGLPPRAPLAPVALHGMFGELHARAWYLFQRVHDIDHTSQIEAVKQTAGYPGAESAR